MKNWIYHHPIGFLNYTSVFSNSAILLGLPNAKTELQSYCDTSYPRGGVNQMWILKNPKDMLEYIQIMSLSSCKIMSNGDTNTLC